MTGWTYMFTVIYLPPLKKLHTLTHTYTHRKAYLACVSRSSVCFIEIVDSSLICLYVVLLFQPKCIAVVAAKKQQVVVHQHLHHTLEQWPHPRLRQSQG